MNTQAVFSKEFYARLSRENRIRDTEYALSVYGYVLPFHGAASFAEFADAISKTCDVSTECPRNNYVYHLLKRYDGHIVRRHGQIASVTASYHAEATNVP